MVNQEGSQYQLDSSNAFLCADLDEQVFVEQSPRFRDYILLKGKTIKVYSVEIEAWPRFWDSKSLVLKDANTYRELLEEANTLDHSLP